MLIETLSIRPSGQPLLPDNKAAVYVHRRRAMHRRIIEQYRRDHTLCQRCLSDGRYTPAAEVHHIQPVAEGGATTERNLLALCLECHQTIHAIPTAKQLEFKAFS